MINWPNYQAYFNLLVFLYELDVHFLAVASRSRQSEKQPIIVELALIEHAHTGRSFRASRTAAMCHRSSDYYRTGLWCNDYPSVNTRDGRIDFIGSTQ